MKLLQLFLSFCKVGLFSIGGGYAAMPLPVYLAEAYKRACRIAIRYTR